MPVYIDGDKIKYRIRKRMQLIELMKLLDMGRETVIAKINGNIVTEFDYVSPKDNVEFIRVSTGG